MDMEVDTNEMEHLITKYYSYGFQQNEILAYLKLLHKMTISIRTLKRILSKHGLYRKKYYSRIEDVVRFIQREIEKSGQLHGYRWMHLKFGRSRRC